MSVVSNGAFTTFIALNGTGYVRVKNDDLEATGLPVAPTESGSTTSSRSGWGRTTSPTTKQNQVSCRRARHTSPIPPVQRCQVTQYEPTVMPA